MSMKGAGAARGFTLVELLTVITILAILSAMAAPVMADMVVRYRIDGLRMELMQSIQQARAEAMVRGNTVTLRRTAGCAIALAGSNDWSCGWVAFVDMDADGQEEAGDIRCDRWQCQRGGNAQLERGHAARCRQPGHPAGHGTTGLVHRPACCW